MSCPCQSLTKTNQYQSKLQYQLHPCHYTCKLQYSIRSPAESGLWYHLSQPYTCGALSTTYSRCDTTTLFLFSNTQVYRLRISSTLSQFPIKCYLTMQRNNINLQYLIFPQLNIHNITQLHSYILGRGNSWKVCPIIYNSSSRYNLTNYNYNFFCKSV